MCIDTKHVCIDKFADINNEYNTTKKKNHHKNHQKNHKTKKMKPVDVKSSTYLGFGVKNNEKYLKLEVGEM